MKIAVVLFRPWSATHRYHSFMANTKRLGFELFGIGPKPGSKREEFLAAILAEMDIPLYPAEDVKKSLMDIKPDVIYGEALSEPFEYTAQRWAAEQGKLGLVLDHAQFLRSSLSYRFLALMKELPNSTLMVTNEEREAECRQVGTPARVVGVPDLDLIEDQYDVRAIRKHLDLRNEPLIAFFPDLYWLDRRATQVTEKEALIPFFQLAKAEGWEVRIHLHADERRIPNSSGPEGLAWGQPRYDYLKWLQDQGARYVADAFPGKIGELEFLPCSSYELIAAADCIFGSSPNFHWKVAALKRWYLYLAISEQLEHRTINPSTLPYLNVTLTLPPFDEIREAIKNPKSFELGPTLIQEWFYKLDRSCWRRMLNLAEELHAKT